jgi:hypothetical protein
VFLLGSLLILIGLWKKLSGNSALALTACLLAVFNANIMEYSTIMMSEIPYLFFSVLALWGLVHMEQSAKTNTGLLKNKYLWITIFSVVVSYYIRTAGLSLVGGALLYLLLKKRWAYAGALLGYRARIRNHGHSCFLCEIVIRSQFHTTYEPEA